MILDIRTIMPNRFANVSNHVRNCTPRIYIRGTESGETAIDDGSIVAIHESSGEMGGNPYTTWDAMNLAQWAGDHDANPHPEMTAWFFRKSGKRWDFLGFGESLETLWDDGQFVKP
jgi:hypothetical protein